MITTTMPTGPLITTAAGPWLAVVAAVVATAFAATAAWLVVRQRQAPNEPSSTRHGRALALAAGAVLLFTATAGLIGVPVPVYIP